jgi:predicted 3-demethylubiquinone-9 3-methyltransferase (glyoxalase superfamily)
MAISNIYPCLWFDGQGEAAAKFYIETFKNGEITANNGMVQTFKLFGQQFMALNGGPQFKINPSISFFVLCDSEAEIAGYWKALADGGKVMMPLDKYPWSEKYGWCQDKFGVCWQLMIGKMQDNTQKIVPSLMFTKAQNGKAEEAINHYTSIFENTKINEIDRYKEGEGDTIGNVKYALFQLNSQYFTAMESSMMHNFSYNEGLSFVIPCEKQEEIDHYWNKLSEGGEESQCGWLKDKYGVSWQVIPEILGKLMSDPEKSQRVIQAFLKMKKFNIQTLLDA